MTQAQKIIEMCQGGDWVCQASFWKAHIFSPHKRRDDVTKITNADGSRLYDFAERSCEHGIERSKDFRLIFLKPPVAPKPLIYTCVLCSKGAVAFYHEKPVCEAHRPKEGMF
jgi:hypothetical protein